MRLIISNFAVGIRGKMPELIVKYNIKVRFHEKDIFSVDRYDFYGIVYR